MQRRWASTFGLLVLLSACEQPDQAPLSSTGNASQDRIWAAQDRVPRPIGSIQCPAPGATSCGSVTQIDSIVYQAEDKSAASYLVEPTLQLIETSDNRGNTATRYVFTYRLYNQTQNVAPLGSSSADAVVVSLLDAAGKETAGIYVPIARNSVCYERPNQSAAGSFGYNILRNVTSFRVSQTTLSTPLKSC